MEIRNDRCFKALVVFEIFEDADDGLGAQPVPDGILPRALFTSFGNRSRASGGVAPVGLILSKGSSWDRPSVEWIGWKCCGKSHRVVLRSSSANFGTRQSRCRAFCSKLSCDR